MGKLTKLIATSFYLGYLPVAGGTVSAFFALAIYYAVKDNVLIYAVTMSVLILMGFLTGGRAERIFGRKDDSRITIDETSGMLVALFMVPQRLSYVAAGFILFRLFDILKPPPIKWLEKLKGSPGVMCDDIAAAVYANLAIQIFRLFIS